MQVTYRVSITTYENHADRRGKGQEDAVAEILARVEWIADQNEVVRGLGNRHHCSSRTHAAAPKISRVWLGLGDGVEHLDARLEVHVALKAHNRQLRREPLTKVEHRSRAEISAGTMGENQRRIWSFGPTTSFPIWSVMQVIIRARQNARYRLGRESNIECSSCGLIHHLVGFSPYSVNDGQILQGHKGIMIGTTTEYRM